MQQIENNNSTEEDNNSSNNSSDNDNDINEYISLQNTQFINDELNEININLYCGYNKNNSIHKLDLNEIDTISHLINNKKSKKNDNYQFNNNKNDNNNTSLIQDEYISNDFFGGHHFIVSGSEDGNVCIWNRITQKIIKLHGHKKSVNCVAWNPKDSFILVSGSDDTQIRVWGPNKT